VLVLSLFDGTFRVVQQISISPTTEQAALGAAHAGSEYLSTLARVIFVNTEGGPYKSSATMQFTDVNNIGGMVPFDEGATMAWLIEYAVWKLVTEPRLT
jgi:hypothetical protein